jgi:hypothetical protein
VKKIRQLIKGDRNEQKPVRELEVLPVSWQNVTEAVAKVWGDPWETASRRHGDPARGIAMLVGRQFAGMSLRQIGEAIGSLSYPGRQFSSAGAVPFCRDTCGSEHDSPSSDRQRFAEIY